MTNANEPITMLHNASERDIVFNGLTKREYFAAMAMKGMIAGNLNTKDIVQTANMAVTQADALIAELNKRE